MKKANIVRLYEILSCPYVLKSRDIAEIFGVSMTTAQKYIRTVQDRLATTQSVQVKNYLTREQVLAYEGWDWDDIKNNALELISAQSRVS